MGSYPAFAISHSSLGATCSVLAVSVVSDKTATKSPFEVTTGYHNSVITNRLKQPYGNRQPSVTNRTGLVVLSGVTT